MPPRPSGLPVPAASRRGPAGPQPGAHFLVVSGAAAGTAAAAGLGGRVLAERVQRDGARASLRMPRAAVPPWRCRPARTCGSRAWPRSSPPTGPSTGWTPRSCCRRSRPPAGSCASTAWSGSEISVSFGELIRRPLIEDYITLCCVSNPVAGPYTGNALWLGASLASPAAPGRDPGRRGPAAVHLRRRVHLRRPGAGRHGRPGRAARGGDERRRAAGRARLPGPDGGSRPVRVRVGVQVDHRHRGDHLRRRPPPTGRGAAGTPRRRSRPNPGSTSPAAARSPAARPHCHRRGGLGAAQGHRRGARSGSTTEPGGRPGWPPSPASTPGGSGWPDWDATPGRHLIQARATDRTGYTQTPAQAPPEPNGATGYPAVTVTVS